MQYKYPSAVSRLIIRVPAHLHGSAHLLRVSAAANGSNREDARIYRGRCLVLRGSYQCTTTWRREIKVRFFGANGKIDQIRVKMVDGVEEAVHFLVFQPYIVHSMIL